MDLESSVKSFDDWIKLYPEKFAEEEIAFSHIRRGDHIFIASGCGEPQYLVDSMVRYVQSHPKAFVDTEIIHVYSFGIAPYTETTQKIGKYVTRSSKTGTPFRSDTESCRTR